jgi:hypothetical protein
MRFGLVPVQAAFIFSAALALRLAAALVLGDLPISRTPTRTPEVRTR